MMAIYSTQKEKKHKELHTSQKKEEEREREIDRESIQR
jgi:hypothetical protein